MPGLLAVLLAATATVLATGLGALPVLAGGDRAERLRPWLDGLVIGVMGVAAVAGLLLPAAREGSAAAVAGGAILGGGALWWARQRLHARFGDGAAGAAPDDRPAEGRARLTFGVLLAHSLPEGLALGSAMAASGRLGTFVVLAIAVQNVPEGTATALALRRAGRGPLRQVEAAVLSSTPQIPGAVLAWLAVDAVTAVLPITLAAAGAAMLLLVAAELVPDGWRCPSPASVACGAMAGGGVTIALALALRPPV
jgi:ZIP family zinc transporter